MFISFLQDILVILFPFIALSQNLLIFIFSNFLFFFDSDQGEFHGFQFVIVGSDGLFKQGELVSHLVDFVIFSIGFFFESLGLHLQFLQNLLPLFDL